MVTMSREGVIERVPVGHDALQWQQHGRGGHALPLPVSRRSVMKHLQLRRPLGDPVIVRLRGYWLLADPGALHAFCRFWSEAWALSQVGVVARTPDEAR